LDFTRRYSFDGNALARRWGEGSGKPVRNLTVKKHLILVKKRSSFCTSINHLRRMHGRPGKALCCAVESWRRHRQNPSWNQPGFALGSFPARRKLHRFCTVFAPKNAFCRIQSLSPNNLQMERANMVQFRTSLSFDLEKL
jgi:hypothetical protein